MEILKQTQPNESILKLDRRGYLSNSMLCLKPKSVNVTVNIIMELDTQFKEIQEKLVDFKILYAHSSMGHPKSDVREIFLIFTTSNMLTQSSILDLK